MTTSDNALPTPATVSKKTAGAKTKSQPRDLRWWIKAAWYEFLRILCRLIGVVCYRLRCEGRERVPTTGAALVLSNHQSHFDPVLIGLSCTRRLNFLARETLFRVPILRPLIQSLNAIPVERDGLGLGGLKETLRRLQYGEFVLIFPEGTRSPDGKVQACKPGFSALAKRAGVPLVPVAIDGAYDIWPRNAKFPRLWGTLHIVYGEPITPAEIDQFDQRELVAEVQRRIEACYAQAAAGRRVRLGLPPE